MEWFADDVPNKPKMEYIMLTEKFQNDYSGNLQ